MQDTPSLWVVIYNSCHGNVCLVTVPQSCIFSYLGNYHSLLTYCELFVGNITEKSDYYTKSHRCDNDLKFNKIAINQINKPF